VKEEHIAVAVLLQGYNGFPWILGRRYENMKAIKIITTMNNAAT